MTSFDRASFSVDEQDLSAAVGGSVGSFFKAFGSLAKSGKSVGSSSSASSKMSFGSLPSTPPSSPPPVRVEVVQNVVPKGGLSTGAKAGIVGLYSAGTVVDFIAWDPAAVVWRDKPII
ncbi:hypothetical protein CB0101_07690 [Synechococcus sp. CB0101]|nr:hypothetical protein CB0101_07690 [Synechococcus sp. CB0101]